MKLGIAEILKKVSEMKKKDDKIDYLRQNDSVVMRQIIQYAFDTRVKWALPEGDPPYKPSSAMDTEGMLYKEARRLYLFIEGGHATLRPLRREALFIDFLQTIAPDDAKLILTIKNKKLPYGITRKLVTEAYPDIDIQ